MALLYLCMISCKHCRRSCNKKRDGTPPSPPPNSIATPSAIADHFILRPLTTRQLISSSREHVQSSSSVLVEYGVDVFVDVSAPGPATERWRAIMLMAVAPWKVQGMSIAKIKE
jgi:hypothetical protein